MSDFNGRKSDWCPGPGTINVDRSIPYHRVRKNFVPRLFKGLFVRLSHLVAVVCVLAVAATAAASQRPKPRGGPVAPSEPGCAYRVVEGDTLQIAATGETIRAASHEAPAISYAACAAERTLGQQSLARAIELVCKPGADVAVEREPVRDVYGRVTAHIRIDGQDLGALLIAERLARPYDGRWQPKPWCKSAK